MLRKVLFILSFLGCFMSAFSQNTKYEKDIVRDFLVYFHLIQNREIGKALDYVNPRFFELVPLNEMQKLLESVFKMSGMEYKLGNPTFRKIGKVQNFNKINYVKIWYASPVEMRFVLQDTDEQTVSAMIANFETQYGAGNVVFDKSTGFYKINAEKSAIASSEENMNNWKFITVDNEKMAAILSKIIPEEVLNSQE